MTQTVSKERIEERVIELIAGFGPRREDLTRDANLEALDVDSLDLVELGQVAEEEFGVTLETNDVLNIDTVGQAIDLVVDRAAL